MEFSKRKAATLASLGSTVTDKSPKGTLDIAILSLLNTINNHPSYFTTSSCSGRISILSQPSTTTTTTANKKARGGSWLFISHDPSDPDTVTNLLFSPTLTNSVTDSQDLVFRFEPLIIAVECKDLVSAQALVSLAIASGFRESGITNTNKRMIIAIRCSIRMEVPLGCTGGGIMVSEEYVRFLVGIANEKMEANRKRTDGFFRALLCNGFEREIEDECEVVTDSGDIENTSVSSNRSEKNTQNGSIEVPGSCISTVRMVVGGEPLEKLFIWGHSACTLPNNKTILVFGGFGGMGRHARRNDSLLLDPFHGTLMKLNVEGSLPSPRLGHTYSLVGNFMYVIGGRADPVSILNDIWVLDTAESNWRLLDCIGDIPPRHRHAAAAIGSKIYIFGGLNNDIVSSSLHVLDTDNLNWNEICINGEWPTARHSHSLVAYGSQLFMFGGYDGEKALGDLYSFNIETCIWKKENAVGRTPYARFSHSAFIYKQYLGILGGCPPRQHCEEMALLDLQSLVWKQYTLNSAGKDLLVRGTSNIVGDDLVIIGGGAACYAFGTKFSEPMIINMLPLIKPSEIKQMQDIHRNKELSTTNTVCVQNKQNGTAETLAVPELDSESKLAALHWVLQLEKKYAKLIKDLLKKNGWLDLRRKVYTSVDRIYICFPVTDKFKTLFHDTRHIVADKREKVSDLCAFKSLKVEEVYLNDVTCSAVLNTLKGYGATLVVDEVVEFRIATKTPLKVMTEAVESLIQVKGLSAQLLEQLPTRWERLGDIVVLPSSSFKDTIWDSIGQEFWIIIAKSLGTHRLARQGRVASTGTRDSTLEILVGDNGWVEHRENGILYSFDVTKCMFSWGNLSEKLRMACLDCKDEIIVDLFAGIGYFTLPFLVRAKVKLVYACEWNPYAIEALRRNLQANSVTDNCIILEGDNRITAPQGVADRVSLGLLPSSEGSWGTAVRALRVNGGTLHVHANVKDSEEGAWTEHVSRSFQEIAKSEGRHWDVSVEHVERVKWYAPHIRHLVADVKCRQMEI